MQAHITGSSNGFQLVVQGHDSPVLAYNITEKTVKDIDRLGNQLCQHKPITPFSELLKDDFDLPKNFVHARNANGRVTMGLHGYRIDEGEYGRMARPFMGWHTDRRHTPFFGMDTPTTGRLSSQTNWRRAILRRCSYGCKPTRRKDEPMSNS